MLKPGISVTGIVGIEITANHLVLRVRCSDGSVALTWWELDRLPQFLTTMEDHFSAEPNVSMQ
jgi:hypothetical protein